MPPPDADLDAPPARARLVSPLGFVAVALGIVVAFAALHVAGLRESTRVLSGTIGGRAEALQGLAYALGYFGAVLVAPVLTIAAAAFVGLAWATRGLRA